MTNTYSIASLAASAYLRSRGMENLASTYACDEGTADIVATDGETTVLVALSAKRQRREAEPPKFSAKRLQRIAMCYLTEHPEVSSLRFDVVEVLVGTSATATVNAVEGAYSWER